MNGGPRPPRPPYWLLAVFVAGFVLPPVWALATIAATMAFRSALGFVRRAIARGERRQREAAIGPALALGTDPHGATVNLGERQLAAHGLIVGASGAGKTTTLLRIVGGQIARGRPVVALDLKGSPEFARRLGAMAAAAGRPLRVWSLDGPEHWNPLAVGNATELKDKLIATERFTEPHYQRAAERYVQSALQVLAAGGRAASLERVVALMDPERLTGQARRLKMPLGRRVEAYVATLTPDQLSAVRGLGTRLALLSESSAGAFLAGGQGAVDLRRALEGGEVVLFSLNAARYGSLAAQVGTLAVQDLVAATGRRLEAQVAGAPPPLATVAIDEFSALGSDQVLALLARGREAGVTVLLATQELSDLERAGRGFRDQVLGLTALKIAHRQDVPASARTLSEIAGSEPAWERTHTVAPALGRAPASRGTRRLVHRPVVRPDEIGRLATGQAVMLTRTPAAAVERVRIGSEDAQAGPRRARAGGGRDQAGPRGARAGGGRDQAEPGVTR
ncbi:MAG TPA: helicase HerA-like domain-containing protein [Solirubrobacteraceae bacterium]|nr:helicase HerA-like domain-containing protein [Solirubrobacteraceae bacterium]